MRIVLFGGSGQVGTILARHFHAQEDAVIVVSRSPTPAPWTVIQWDASTLGRWVDAIADSEVWINLTGRSVNCRYNASNRKAIYDSRVLSTRLLHEALSIIKAPPRVWMNASTATIYRQALDRNMDEGSGEIGGNELGVPETWNFSIAVAKAWEEAFFGTATPHTRKVALRSAMTFSPDRGGVFDVLLGLARRGLGGPQGAGTQYVSWIHEVDFTRAVDWLIANVDFEGVANLASPNPLPNREFMRVLRQTSGVRFGLPAPVKLVEIGAFLLRTESELVLKSRRVVPGRLLDSGFDFRFPRWPEAAKDLVARHQGFFAS